MGDVTDAKRKPGRPPHAPSAESRELAFRLAAMDQPVSIIAQALGISEPTVRLHYAAVIARARPQLIFPFLNQELGRMPPRNVDAGGRPAHSPTQETRDRVEILVAGGQRAWQIAAALGISEPTLREHYPEELAHGRAKRTAQMLEALFQAGAAGNVSAQKAWLAQFRELEEPPTAAEPAPNQPLGKKEAAKMAALTAEKGSDWDGLLPN